MFHRIVLCFFTFLIVMLVLLGFWLFGWGPFVQRVGTVPATARSCRYCFLTAIQELTATNGCYTVHYSPTATLTLRQGDQVACRLKLSSSSSVRPPLRCGRQSHPLGGEGPPTDDAAGDGGRRHRGVGPASPFLLRHLPGCITRAVARP